MQALLWILRLLIVLVLVWFAVKNAQQVEIYGLPGQVWQAPLVFVLLVVFVAGVIIGLLAWIPTVIRQRREIGRLRRAAAAAPVPGTAVPGTAVLPPEPSGTDVHGI